MSEERSRPTLDTLADYLEGLLTEEENRAVERWVAEDAVTAELLHELEELPGLLAADAVEPMPGDVVGRVDAALAAAARDDHAGRETGAGAVVVPLRRRRWLAPALAAAAVVGMVAIGSQVVSSVGPIGMDSAGEAGGGGALTDGEAADRSVPESEEAQAPTDSGGGVPLPPSADEAPSIRTDSFASDVNRALDADELVRGGRMDWSAGLAERRSRYTILSRGCAVDLGADRVLPIRLDGDPALLVLRRIPGEPDRREALAYPARCPDGEEEANEEPLASAVVLLP